MESKQDSSETEFDQAQEVWHNGDKALRVDMAHQRPLNDPNCEHEFFLDEDDGDSAWAEIWRCRKCPLGQAVQRDRS